VPDPSDPFARHPELRGRIVDPETSFFRDFSIARLMALFPEIADQLDWMHSDAVREAYRAEALAGHAGDLWIFAYGSLIWDPALRFREVRRARVAGFARRLILFDDGGARGTAEAPGLMAALDRDESPGAACDGLVFRIAAADVDTETEILWRREMIGPAYLPAFVTADLDDGPVQALTFVANHASAKIRPDLTRDDQIRCIAHGAGRLGTSREYLANIVDHFTHLGISDEHCADLLRAVDAYLAAHATREPAR